MTNENRKRSFPGLGMLNDLRDMADKVPTEETLTRLLDELPRIERILTDPKIDKLARLADVAESLDSELVRKLEQFLPLMKNLPDNKVLVDIVNMKPYLQRIPSTEDIRALAEKLPSKAEMERMFEFFEELKGFLSALKGG